MSSRHEEQMENRITSAGTDVDSEPKVEVTTSIPNNGNTDVICSACGGYGYTIEIEAECCGNYKHYGCCGVPNPVQVQVECKCDNGYVRSEHCI